MTCADGQCDGAAAASKETASATLRFATHIALLAATFLEPAATPDAAAAAAGAAAPAGERQHERPFLDVAPSPLADELARARRAAHQGIALSDVVVALGARLREPQPRRGTQLADAREGALSERERARRAALLLADVARTCETAVARLRWEPVGAPASTRGG